MGKEQRLPQLFPAHGPVGQPDAVFQLPASPGAETVLSPLSRAGAVPLCAQPYNLPLPPAVPEAPSLPRAPLPFSMTALPGSLQRKAGNPKP